MNIQSFTSRRLTGLGAILWVLAVLPFSGFSSGGADPFAPAVQAEEASESSNARSSTRGIAAHDSDASLPVYLPMLHKAHATRTNRPPQVSAGADRIVALPEGAIQITVTLEGSATDPDRLDRVIGYHWTGTPQPEPNNVREPQVRLGLGRHSFELRVFDLHGSTATDSVTIEVIEDLPGVASGSDWRLWGFEPTSETLIATVRASPNNDRLDGRIGFFDDEDGSLEKAAVQLRFNVDGHIDALDGDRFRAIDRLGYEMGAAYEFRIVVNLPEQSFDAWVTKEDGVPALIARDYSFQPSAVPMQRVSHLGIYSAKGSFQGREFVHETHADYKRVTPKTTYGWFPEVSGAGAVVNTSPTPGEGWYGTADIHPDGRDMIFHGAAWGNARVWRYTFASQKIEALTPPDFVAVEPAYSADGEWIVFTSDKGLDLPRFDMFEVGRSRPQEDGFKGGYTSAANLFVMDAEGKNLRQLTDGEVAVDKRGSFSPDGETVVFLSSRGAQTLYMWTVPFDGSLPPSRLQMDGSPWVGRPRYSPSGEEIFFFSGITNGAYDPRGRHTLCRVPAEGGAWRILPNDSLGIGSHGPAPDPSGQQLWYHAYNNDLWGLYKLPLAGGPPTRIIPPGFARFNIAHATEATSGVVAFDSRAYLEMP